MISNVHIETIHRFEFNFSRVLVKCGHSLIIIYPWGWITKSIPREMDQEIYPEGWIRKPIPRDGSGNLSLGMDLETFP